MKHYPHGRRFQKPMLTKNPICIMTPLCVLGLGTVTTSRSSGRIRVYHAAGLSAFHRFVRLASRATSCTSTMLEIMPYALTPAYGVTSMPFRPGCHRPFHHSVVLRSYASAVIVVARFSIRLDFFIRFCHHLDIMLQHFLTSTVIALRPFTPYFNSWCLLRQSIVTPLCRWWFSGTHP